MNNGNLKSCSSLNLFDRAKYDAAIALGQNTSIKFDENHLNYVSFMSMFKSNFESVIKNDGVTLFAI